MRATLIGRFLLLALAGLVVLLPLWYWAREWFAAPPLWLAGTVMKLLFAWVERFSSRESSLSIVDLPAPFLPISPTRSPALSIKATSSKRYSP